MISSDTLYIRQWDTAQQVKFADAVTSLNVSYEINGCAQLTVEVADYKMEMVKNNYFQLKTQILFKGDLFRIASVELSQGEGEYTNVKLELRDDAVQRMKEDKTPQSYKSATGYEFAEKVAKKFGLKFIGEQAKGVKQATVKVKAKNNKESVWDVLQRASQDVQFLCFVSGGILFYASPKFLLGTWGIYSVEGATLNNAGKLKTLKYVPLLYPSDNSQAYFLMEMPNVRRSEDSPKESEGKASLWGGPNHETADGNAYDLRPGMTVVTYGIPGFQQAYLITSIAYQYSQPEPVEITFATVDKLAPADKAKIDAKVSEVTVISGTGGG